MARQIRIVDVFTDRALTGNQLAVVLDGEGLTDQAMQRIAKEMNFSETTFVLPPDDGTSAARVRIFTPAFELPFAGHPTIGTSWVLVDEGMVPGGSPEFALQEKVGPVPVRGEREGDRLVFWMRHPKLTFGDTRDHAHVAAALGLTPEDLLPGIPAQFASTGVQFLYVALRDAAAVDRATSNRERLQTLTEDPHFGVFLFAVSGPDRLYSRMFSLDTPEDPATGSASGPLGAIAVKHGLVARSPRVSLVSEQGSKMGRQSFIRIVLEYADGDDIPSLIEVGGAVAPVVRGTLTDFT